MRCERVSNEGRILLRYYPKTAGKRSYNKMFVSYLRIFKKMELNAIPMKAESGPIGGNMSHEFIILAETGESRVFIDKTLLELEVHLMMISTIMKICN